MKTFYLISGTTRYPMIIGMRNEHHYAYRFELFGNKIITIKLRDFENVIITHKRTGPKHFTNGCYLFLFCTADKPGYTIMV